MEFKKEYCDLCKKEVNLKKPHWKIEKYGRKGCYLGTVYFCNECNEG